MTTFRFASPLFLALLIVIPVLILLRRRMNRVPGLRYADTRVISAARSWRRGN